MPKWMRFLAAALAGLAVVYALTLIPRREKAPVFAAAPAEVVKIVVSGQDVHIELEKVGADWRMRRPVDYPANAEAIGYFLDAAHHHKAEAMQTRRAESHADYGLTPETVKRVELWGAGAGKPLVWLFGKATPQGGAFVALPDGPEVFLTSGLPPDGIVLDPARWRDAAIVPEAVARVRVKGFGKDYFVAATSDTWTIDGKPAPRENVEAVLAGTARLTADDFIDPPASLNLKKWGLAPPALTVDATLVSGRTIRIAAGKNEHGRLVLRRGEEKTLFWINAAAFPFLKAAPDRHDGD